MAMIQQTPETRQIVAAVRGGTGARRLPRQYHPGTPGNGRRHRDGLGSPPIDAPTRTR